MPAPLTDLLSASAKDELRQLELLARRTVDGIRHGLHRSRCVGVSTDFDHHKGYAPGDPLKHIDWKASARHDRYFVKRYLEDRALGVRLVVDRSASMLQASSGTSKYRQAARLAACLAYLVIKEHDAAGLVLSSAAGTVWVPPSSRALHLIQILQRLADTAAAAQDSLEVSLRTLVDRGDRKGLVCVLSDLLFDPAAVQRELGRLHAQGHEVLIFQVRDAQEEEFPFNRWVQFGDLENAAVRHRLDGVLLKRLYREEYQALGREWEAWARKFGAHLIAFRTEQDVGTVLAEYLAYRARVGRAHA